MQGVDKRVYIIAGHYGSGKTNIAVNLALALKGEGKAVTLADLDIVNPYFRSADSERELVEKGVKVILPAFANTNVDLPSLPPEAYSMFQNRNTVAIIDVGGDDRGAYALGRYTPYILEENNYEMCFVANFYRPLTRTAEDAIEVMREIESACKIKFTAIINNSNLGDETTANDILATKDECERLSALTGLKVLFTTSAVEMEGAFPLVLQSKYYDIKE